MRPQATSVCGLKLLLCEALSYCCCTCFTTANEKCLQSGVGEVRNILRTCDILHLRVFLNAHVLYAQVRGLKRLLCARVLCFAMCVCPGFVRASCAHLRTSVCGPKLLVYAALSY
jgi:hypothetical protein